MECCYEKKLVCVSCPMGCRLTVTVCGDNITVTGNTCKRGEVYGKNEVTDPRRMICSTARIEGGVHPVVPVKTDKPIPEKLKFKCMDVINALDLKSPVTAGDVVAANILDTDVNIVVTRNM